MGSPSASSSAVSRRMSRQGVRDTAPELLLRRELHRRGLRYRVHRKPIASFKRTVDIAFPTERVAVVVHGCFWHACPKHATFPKANAEWWREKLATNVRRDCDTKTRLTSAGWICITVWEHEDPVLAAARIQRKIESRRVKNASSRRSGRVGTKER